MPRSQRTVLLILSLLFIASLAWAGMLYLTSSTSSPSSLAVALEDTQLATETGLVPARPDPTATRSPTPEPTPSPTPTSLPSPTLTPTEKLPTYVFPVQPATLATYARGHHDYPAADIFAPEGTTFVAVTDGVVDYISLEDTWVPGIDDPATRGGMAVAILGDDGIRYYGSHLSSIVDGLEPGQRVTSGMVIGYVGSSGNARYVAPHLHFGISRPTYPEDWAVRRGEVDPYPYLKAWEQNENLTPKLP